MAGQTGKQQLNLNVIVTAAIAMSDAHGIAGMSMRKLGQELGVEAMSLYHYVPNKAQLLRHMTDEVVHSMELPSPDTPWKAEMRAMSLSAYRQLMQHPWVMGEFLNIGANYSPARFRWMDAMLGCLRTNGFSVELTHHTFHVLDGHIIGSAYLDSAIPTDPETSAALMAEVRPIMARLNLPYLNEHVQYHIDFDGAGDEHGEFAFALDLILDGVERLYQREGGVA